MLPQVLLWSMRSYALIRRLEGHQSSVVSCDFSPDSALLVTASYDACVIMWDPYTGEQLRTLRYGDGDGTGNMAKGGLEGLNVAFSPWPPPLRCFQSERGFWPLCQPQSSGDGACGSLGVMLGLFSPPQPRPPALSAG